MTQEREADPEFLGDRSAAAFAALDEFAYEPQAHGIREGGENPGLLIRFEKLQHVPSIWMRQPSLK
jgi:hypothetical protein